MLSKFFNKGLAVLNAKTNFFYITVTLSLSIFLTLFVAKSTLSNERLVVPDSNYRPICYMQTEDDTVINLSNICDKKAKANTSNYENIKQLLTTKQCQNCDLSGANLSSSNLIGADLIGANLSNADLSNANMLGANLNNTNMSNTKLSGAIMPDGTIHE